MVSPTKQQQQRRPLSSQKMKRNQRIQKMTHGDVEIRHYLEQMNKNIMQSVLYKKFKYEKALININTTLGE